MQNESADSIAFSNLQITALYCLPLIIYLAISVTLFIRDVCFNVIQWWNKNKQLSFLGTTINTWLKEENIWRPYLTYKNCIKWQGICTKNIEFPISIVLYNNGVKDFHVAMYLVGQSDVTHIADKLTKYDKKIITKTAYSLFEKLVNIKSEEDKNKYIARFIDVCETSKKDIKPEG